MKTTSLKSRVQSNEETSTTARMQFELKALGPAVFHPELFLQILQANSDTWHIIDRGGLDTLVPIWEIVTDLHPELNQQCEFMRKAWLGKTSKIPLKFIEQQRARIKQNVSKQVKNDREAELRTKLESLYRQELISMDESNLLNQIKLIFEDINFLHHNKPPSMTSSPWVNVVKEERFHNILKRLVSEQQLTDKFPRALRYLELMLTDDVLQIMDHSGFPIDQTIQSHLKAKPNATSSPIKDDVVFVVTAETFLEQFIKKAQQENISHKEKVQGIQTCLISFLLASSTNDVDEKHNAIEDLLINKYSWRSNSFSEGITAEGIRDLVRDVETIKNGPIISSSPIVHDECISADETTADYSFNINQPPPNNTIAKVKLATTN